MEYWNANQYNDYYGHNGWIYAYRNFASIDSGAYYSSWALNTWFIGRFIRVSGSNKAQVFNTGRTALAGPTSGITDGSGTGHYYGFAGSDTNVWYADWFFLRSYSANEPAMIVNNPPPTVMWNATPLFANSTTGIIFVDNSTGTNITAGGGNFNWSFNNDATDKNVSSLRNWTHKFPCNALPAADSCYYSVNHSVTDSPGTPWSNTSWLNQTNYLRVFQNTSPTVNLTGTPLSGVSQLSVTFNATPLGAIKVDNWSWVFGDGHTSYNQNDTNFYSSAGSLYGHPDRRELHPGE